MHTSERAADTDIGWAYRASYPSAAWMQQLASDIAGRPVDIPWLPDGAIEDAQVTTKLSHAHIMLEAGTDPLAAETALTAGFALLLSRHARSKQQPQALHPDFARVQAMQAKLAEELAESVTLTARATTVGLSPFHVTRLFSRSVGMPPHGMAQPVATQSRAGFATPGHVGDRCGGGHWLYRPKPFHAPFQTRLRHRAGALRPVASERR